MNVSAVFLGFTLAKIFDPLLFVLALIIGYKAKNRILVSFSAFGYGVFSGLIFNGFSGERFFINFAAAFAASFVWFFLVYELARLWRNKKQVDVGDFE
jgi:hypothetical protein